MEQALENETASIKPTSKAPRNYELDFLRVVFALIIFLSHTQYNGFIGPNTRFKTIPMMGEISVHFFFIVSGMLMANSIVRQNINKKDCGKAAIDYILRKFKSMAWILVVTGAICVGVNLFIYFYLTGKNDPELIQKLHPTQSPLFSPGVYNGEGNISEAGKMLAKIFPELFEVSMAGINLRFNSTWYISAMLISMLPIAYIMYRNRSFTLYVFAPLTALLTFGYMCWVKDYNFAEPNRELIGGILRAACGVCFGICAYTICDKIKGSKPNKHMRVLLTVAEALLYLIFFAVWIFSWDRKSIMSVALLHPIAVAISFSGKSYIGKLFRFKWMKCLGPMAFYIYLVHNGIAMLIVQTFYHNKSWEFCTAMSAIYTITFSLMCWSIIHLCKTIWEKKLKTFFTKPDGSLTIDKQ